MCVWRPVYQTFLRVQSKIMLGRIFCMHKDKEYTSTEEDNGLQKLSFVHPKPYLKPNRGVKTLP